MNNAQNDAATATKLRRKRKREREKANKQRALQERLRKARTEARPPPYDPDYDSSSDSDSGGDDGYYGDSPAMQAPPPPPAEPAAGTKEDEELGGGGQMVTGVMADLIYRSMQQFETAAELEERVVPASALLDTMSFAPRRSLANLAGFMETCTVPSLRQTDSREEKSTERALC